MLKLRQMGTQGVHMKGFLPWLVRLARSRFLSCLARSSRPSTKYFFFPHRTLFHFIRTHRLASWAGSRAGSPVS
jgi:hypothetical protein